jgi:hypothetical protein
MPGETRAFLWVSPHQHVDGIICVDARRETRLGMRYINLMMIVNLQDFCIHDEWPDERPDKWSGMPACRALSVENPWRSPVVRS